jgi:DNA invertase Pin-like site-specific DNA recombinase
VDRSFHGSVLRPKNLRERTMAGLRAARARGRNGGRPKKLRTKDIQAVKALMHAGELPVQDIAD